MLLLRTTKTFPVEPNFVDFFAKDTWTAQKIPVVPQNAKKVLYSVANSLELTQVESKSDQLRTVIFTVMVSRFLPIRLVIRDGALITLWPIGGFKDKKITHYDKLLNGPPL